MDHDEETSDDAARRAVNDEYELPRVMWVPDSVENQEDFLRKTRKDAFQALPCTQTTESSRLLRNTSLETPRRGETTAGTTGTNLFATTDHTTPSARRPTRRIRSLPTPYSASASTNSSRRSTLDGSSSRSVGSTSTPTARTRDPIQSAASTESFAGSPSDRLGQLMSQLGERFSHRNEARKRRAEMQEKVNLQNQQLEAARMERARREAEERKRMHADHGPSEVQGRPHLTVLPKQAVPLRNPHTTEHEAKRRAVEAHPQAPQVRPRHPLAQSDVNQRPIHVNHLPPKSVPVGRPPQNQQPQIISGPIKATNIFAQVANQVQQESRPQARSGYQAHPAALPSFTRPTINHPAPNPIVTPPVPPAVVADPEEPGNHQNSDTSFESMTDMEGLFNEGGEEVEALLKACDGF